MAATTVYVQSFTWGGGTYNAGLGGPIRLEFQHEGTPFMDRTGDDEYSPFVCVTDKRLIVRVRLRAVKFVSALGVKSDASANIIGKSTAIGGSAIPINFAGLVFIGASPGEQGRAEGGSVTLVFEHESVSSGAGQAVPIS